MNRTLALLQRRLQEEADKVTSFYRGLSPRDWQCEVYTEGTRWSVHHVLAHFVSTERAFLSGIRKVLEGKPEDTRDIDIDEFNEREVAEVSQQEGQELLDLFREARDDTLALLKAITEDDLERKGVHPWYGEVTLGWLLKLIYRHNMIHLRDMRKALNDLETV